jgi:hypothetical protein
VAQELVEMSSKELDRLTVVRQVLEGRLTQAKAAEFVGLSERQMRRLCAVFEKRGPAGLVAGKRGPTDSMSQTRDAWPPSDLTTELEKKSAIRERTI